MKRYNVECRLEDKGMIEGWKARNSIRDNYVGDFVEAENKDDAIEIAIECIIRQSDGEVRQSGQNIIFYDELGEVAGGLYDFEAIEIE